MKTDENGGRTLTIMRPNGTTKEVRLGSKGPPPEVGDLITAFHAPGGDDDEDGDGPPTIGGLVRAQEVRQRLEGFLQDLSDRAADALEKVEERRAERIVRLAERLEAHAAKHADSIKRVSQNDKLPPQAVAGMLNGLERAEQGYSQAKVKAAEAWSRGPGLQVDRGNSGRGNQDDNGSSDNGNRGNSGSNGKGNQGNGRSGGGGLNSSGSGS